MSLLTKRFYTPAEYLKREETAETKSEFRQGIVTQMTGASFAHNRIAMNMGTALQFALKRKPCQVFGSDLRVQVQSRGLYTYPDVLVICGEPEFAKGRNDTITNPMVIVEVLSPATRAYERGQKFELYRALVPL